MAEEGDRGDEDQGEQDGPSSLGAAQELSHGDERLLL
jgi:hypothetical protein